MNIMTFILTVTMIWIVLIFISLPIGLKFETENYGGADSAPSTHYYGLKMLITLVLSIVITSIYCYVYY